MSAPALRRFAEPAALLEACLVLLLATSSFLAAQPLVHAYRVAGTELLMASAVIAPAIAGFATIRLLRWPTAGSYAVSAVGLAGLLVVAAGPAPGAIAESVVRGPGRILTETLPLAGSGTALSAALLLTWVCSAATCEIVLRARPGRSMFALVVPLMLYLASYAAASGAPGRADGSGPALLAAVAVAAAVGRERASRRDGGPGPDEATDGAPAEPWWRSVATGLVLAGAVALLALTVVPRLPSMGGRALGLHRPPPQLQPVVTDPVGVMANLRDGDPGQAPVVDLKVTLSGPSDGYLAMAVADQYDGAQWRFDADFQPTGGRVPPVAGASQDEARGTVRQHIDITRPLPLPFLPALDRAASVTGLAARADRVSGMLIPQAGAGTEKYEVTSTGDAKSLGGLPPADGLDLYASAGDLQIPSDTSSDLATAVRFLSSLTATRPAPDLSFLQQVLDSLHSYERRLEPAPPTSASDAADGSATVGGTSLSEVINAVTVNRAATPEQFATLFAMVARYLGVPARLVTGFRVAPSSDGSSLPAGRYDVTNRQAWAWDEIPVSGLGWVVADPTPASATTVSAPPPEAVQATTTTLPNRQANAVPRNSMVGHAIAPRGHVYFPRSTSTPVWVWPLVGIGGALVIFAVMGPLQAGARRVWRRRRRKSSDPALLAVGAWLELVDGLWRSGLRGASGLTNAELASEAALHFGGDYRAEVEELAAVADQALFCPTTPPDEPSAQRAWELQRGIRRRINRSLHRRDRARAALLVGSAPDRPGS